MRRTGRVAVLVLLAALLGGLTPIGPAGVARAAAYNYNGIWGTSDYLSSGTPMSTWFGARWTSVMTRGYTPPPTNTDVVLTLGSGYLIIGNQNGTLDPGAYENASVGSFQPDRPRLDVSPSPKMDCPGGTPIGRFVILEAPVIENDAVTQFAADFEIRCDGWSQLRGSVRVNSEIPFRSLDPYQTHDTAWITVPSNGHLAKTITIANMQASTDPDDTGGAFSIGLPTIGGPDAGAFSLSSTTCIAGILELGESCTVTVVFDPLAEGTVRAVIDLPTDLPLGDLLLDIWGTAGPPATNLPGPGTTDVRPKTFYPYPDGYRDTVRIDGYNSTLTWVRVDVRNSSGTLVRRFSVSDLVQFEWSTTWDGRNNSGSRVGAGTYRITTVYTDLADNVASTSTSVTVSSKRLVTHTKTLTVHADQFAAKGAAGTGRISSKSAYARGRKIRSGADGFAALGYSFRIPSATVYSKFVFKAVGGSPNGTRAIIGIQNFGIDGAWTTEAFDELAWAGPRVKTWTVATTATSYHRSGRTVHGMVYVEPSGAGANQAFDFSKAKLKVIYQQLE